MTHLLFLIPLSIAMGLVGLWAFFWTMRNNQYDDPDGDAWRVIIPSDPPVDKDPSEETNVAPDI